MTQSPLVWSVVQQLGRQAASYLVFLILAALLAPRDLGILGMAMVWISFLMAFSEVGFSAALIQRQNVESKHLSSTFYLNIVLGIVLSLVGVLSSWPVATVMKTPEVQPVIAVLSLGFFLSSLSLTQMAIAQREFRFRDLAVRDISAALVGGVVGIVLASLGYGVWSLVVQSLLTSGIGTLLIWRLSYWRPRLGETSLDCIKELWGYSSKIFYFNVFKYFAQNIDRIVIGYFLGPVTLGLYTFAYKIVVFPVAYLVGAIGGYLFPKFARMQGDVNAVRSAYLLVIKAINSVVTPVLLIVGVSSPTLVPLIFGDKWVAAVPMMQIFIVVAVAQSLISPVGQLMKALNRPGWLFNWSVLVTFLAAFCLLLATPWGVMGVSIGLAASYIIALPVNYAITAKMIPMNTKLMLKALFPALASSLVLSICLWLALNLDIPSVYFKIAIGLLVSISSYMLVLIHLDRAFISSTLQRVLGHEVSRQ